MDGSSWIVDHVYWTSPWKAGVSSLILLVGSCRETKLKPKQVYVLIESIYVTMVLPVVLVCLGVMSTNDALICLRNVSIPVVFLVGVRTSSI